MKLPRSCPNSSLSMRVGGSPPQSTTSNGWCARGLAAWTARAASSFPVPLSPVTSTGAVVGAARSSASNTARIAADPPRSPPSELCAAVGMAARSTPR